jgi:hypothetical protein
VVKIATSGSDQLVETVGVKAQQEPAPTGKNYLSQVDFAAQDTDCLNLSLDFVKSQRASR